MPEVPVPQEWSHVIRTCIVINGDDERSVLAIDSRQFSDPAEFLRIRIEAFDELQRRRVVCEWETRPVRPGTPSSTLPTWAEYQIDLDRKHPLPRDDA
jgi:hypothetical protein